MSGFADDAGNAGRLSDQVAVFVRSRIFSGELQPGQRLLEVDLCSELGISRAPLREAFLNLQREGLVEVHPYRGATVASYTPDDLAEITELRAALEGLAARLAAQRRSSSEIRRMLEALAKMREAAEADDSVGAAVAHIEFHRSIGRASGLGRLVAFLDQLSVHSLALHGYADLSSEELLELAASHTPLISVIESGDAAAAEQALVRHIKGLSAPIRRYLEHEILDERAGGGREHHGARG